MSIITGRMSQTITRVKLINFPNEQDINSAIQTIEADEGLKNQVVEISFKNDFSACFIMYQSIRIDTSFDPSQEFLNPTT